MRTASRTRLGVVAFMVTLAIAGSLSTPAFAAPRSPDETSTLPPTDCAFYQGFVDLPAPLSDGTNGAAEQQDAEILAAAAVLVNEQSDSIAGVEIVSDDVRPSGLLVLPIAGDESAALSAVDEVARTASRGGTALEIVTAVEAPGQHSMAALCEAFMALRTLPLEPDIVRYFIDVETNAVVVSSLDPSSTAEWLAANRIADATRVELWADPLPELTHRANDVNGFNAGMGITINGGQCSASFTMRGASGTRFLLTADHCGPGGAVVRNGHISTLCWPGLSGNTYVGTLGSSLSGAQTDVEAIYGSGFAAPLWRGSSCTGNYEASVLGAIGYPSQQAIIGFSGIRTGEAQGVVIDSAPACYTLGGQQVCNLFRASSTNGPMCQGGDSGGPVFAFAPNTNAVYAAGVINGSSSIPRPGFTQYYCFFTPVSIPAYLYGTSIVTS